MDRNALTKISGGLYLLTTVEGGRGVGCAVSAVRPLATAAPLLTLSLHKENTTAGAVRRRGVFALSVLAQSAPAGLIGRFGFSSSAETDKFQDLPVVEFRAMPCPAEHVNAILICRVKDITEAGDHLLVLAEATDAAVLSDAPCLRDDAYRSLLRGPVPPRASPLLK